MEQMVKIINYCFKICIFNIYSNVSNGFTYLFYFLGESGSGKTEAARIILQFLVLVTGDTLEIKLIKDRLVQANTLLEAFGNAKTMKNDNASRFVRMISFIQVFCY